MICPACGFNLREVVSICPCCGLRDMDRVFLSREDRDKWVQQVLRPFIDGMIPEIHVGKKTAIFLTQTGYLYGVGRNDKHQISETASEWIGEPLLIASNVKSADIGPDYVIWADSNGTVRLNGSGEYTDMFTGFNEARKVLADPNENIFWIINRKGEVYCFGNNFNGLIVPREETIFPISGDFCGNIRFVKGIQEHPDYSDGNETTYYYTNNEDSERKKILVQAQNSTLYRSLHQKYGRTNVSLELQLKRRTLVSGKSFEDQEREEKRYFTATILITNEQIFSPVKVPFSENKIPIPARNIPMDFSIEMRVMQKLKAEVSGFKKLYMHNQGDIVIFTTSDNQIHMAMLYEILQYGNINAAVLKIFRHE